MMAREQQNKMRDPGSVGSCGDSSRQSSRIDGGYNADCSSLSNFSDSSSSFLDAPKGIHMNAPHRTRSMSVRASRKKFDVSSYGLLLPMKIADLKKIADVDDGAAVSALDDSKDRLGRSASLNKNSFSGSISNFAIPSLSPNNLPSESAVNTDGTGHENLHNKKETYISRVLPQRKNLRVVNPIDPRIDLSSVSLVHASTLHARSTENDPTVVNGGMGGIYPSPNHERYLRLMESYLPFFNAYALSSKLPTSNDEMKAAATKKAIQIGEVMLKCLESDGTFSSQTASDVDKNSDATSVILSRAKQKYQGHSIDHNDHEFPSEKMPKGMDVCIPQNKLTFQNSSSSASSDGQHVSQENSREADGLEQESRQGQEVLQQHDHQEQTLQGPRIVSDTMHSSSANNGTSNGSGGSGNDTYGARQEAGSNSDSRGDSIDAGAKLRNSKENIQLDHARERTADAENINLKGERHNYSLPNLSVSHGNNSHHPTISSTRGGKVTEVITATAHTRLATKKRKRMDRRREYEEVKRQFQESSESCESFAEELFCPGSLVSLEKSLSFTKTAR